MSAELVKDVTLDGQLVARIRCYDGDAGSTIVDAQVAPPGGQPVRRGPYRFGTAHEAFRFLQEATLALQYLGCSIA